jgi:hypothetical protein
MAAELRRACRFAEEQVVARLALAERSGRTVKAAMAAKKASKPEV